MVQIYTVCLSNLDCVFFKSIINIIAHFYAEVHGLHVDTHKFPCINWNSIVIIRDGWGRRDLTPAPLIQAVPRRLNRLTG